MKEERVKPGIPEGIKI